MQHDTSPHRVMIAGRSVTAQCASLVLACSRRLFAQYYSRYTRFEAKHFLLEAVRFMRIHPVSTGGKLFPEFSRSAPYGSPPARDRAGIRCQSV
jgi:hypothetical protein